MTSAQEEANIAEGMELDVRSDGRTLLQVRNCTAKIGVVSHADGSCLADLGGTSVLATVQASVVPVSSEAGTINVKIDCAPGVVSAYATNVGTTSNRFRSSFLSGLASTVSALLGSTTTARDATDAVNDDEDHSSLPTPFSPLPLGDLYCGSGFGFQLTIDVQILQAFGGSIISATSFAVRGALQSLRLPQVSVRESPVGCSVEVDKTKKFHKTIDWSDSPVALACHIRNSRFIVDPSLCEEAALPLCAVAAFGGSGRLTLLNLSTSCSKRSQAAGFCISDLRQLISDAAGIARSWIATFDAQVRAS